MTLDLSAADVTSIFDGHDAVWIQVRDADANKIYPRQRFSYVPYALRVPVDGATLGYDPTTGQLKVLTVPTTGVASITAGTGFTSSNSNGAVTLNVDVGNTANKIVQLDGSAKIAYSVLPVGTVASTVAAGNDARLSDSRIPTGTAGGDLSGSYPNPTLKSSATLDSNRAVSSDHIKTGAVTLAKLAANAVDSSKIINDSIVDADIASSATITDSKLATISSANKVANSATTATNLNTNNAIVMRDGSGNFSAGTITANLTGDVTGNVSGSSASFTGALSGDVSGNQGSTNVIRIQGRSVAATIPSTGQALAWNGTAWAPQIPGETLRIGSKSTNAAISGNDSGKFILVTESGTTLTLPAAASVESGFHITVKAVSGHTIVQITGSDLLDGVNQAKTLPKNTVAQFVSDGTQWHVGMSYGLIMDGAPVPCGSNCYANVSAMNAGRAVTASGKLLTLEYGVWTEVGGPNLLQNDGSDHWQTFTVSYDANGGSSPPVDNTAYFADAVVTTAAPGSMSRLGYQFVGWNTSPDGTGLPFAAGSRSFTIGASNWTFFAVWALMSYTVTYDPNGSTSGSVPATSSHTYNSSVTVAANPGSLARTGYALVGWNTAADGSGIRYVPNRGQFTIGATDVTLYAEWWDNQICGGPGDSCYTVGPAPAGITTTTPLGKSLKMNEYNVWEEDGGTRVLAVDGSDAWHTQLAGNGRSFTTTPIDKANVAGRACPSSVYVNDSDMVASGRCLYYDGGNANQRLDAPNNDQVTDQTTAGAYRLGRWDTAAGGAGTAASWYEGNIQTCAAKGMRLPTLYEVSGAPPSWGAPSDASPTWSGTKVPLVQYWWGNGAWTASAVFSTIQTPSAYFFARGALDSPWSDATWSSYDHVAVRCVIP